MERNYSKEDFSYGMISNIIMKNEMGSPKGVDVAELVKRTLEEISTAESDDEYDLDDDAIKNFFDMQPDEDDEDDDDDEEEDLILGDEDDLDDEDLEEIELVEEDFEVDKDAEEDDLILGTDAESDDEEDDL